MTRPDAGERPLNIHGLLDRSQANGPGVRTVVWVQGCARGCPGCFNPDTHPLEPRHLILPRDLCDWVMGLEQIGGLTISGGEPLLQARGLAAFLRLLRTRCDLSVVLYSGFLVDEVRSQPYGEELLGLCDVLIDGPYDQAQPAEDGFRGSRNQRVHVLTGRHSIADFRSSHQSEFVIAPDGTVVRTGLGHIPATDLTGLPRA